MRSRRIAALFALCALSGCQLVLGLEEGKKRDAGAATGGSGGGGGECGSSASAASEGAGGVALCKIGAACAGDADCVSGACVEKACALSPRVLLLATGPKPGAIDPPEEYSVLAGALDKSKPSTWSTQLLAGRSVSPPSLTITPEGRGVGVVRFTNGNDTNNNMLMFGTWTAGRWSKLELIAKDISTYRDPSVTAVASSEAVHMAFLEEWASGMTSGHQQHIVFDGSAWGSSVEQVSSSKSCDSPASIAASGDELLFAYFDYQKQLYAQVGIKADPFAFGDPGTMTYTFPPGVVKLSALAEAMVAYFHDQDRKIYYHLLNGGNAWTPRLELPGAEPLVPPANEKPDEQHRLIALTALANGAAAVAYRGADMMLHVVKYTPGQTPPWSPILPNAEVAAIAVDSTPAIARGVGGDEIELAYVNGAQVFHTSYTGSSWRERVAIPVPADPPAQGGGTRTFPNIVIATAP